MDGVERGIKGAESERERWSEKVDATHGGDEADGGQRGSVKPGKEVVYEGWIGSTSLPSRQY